MKNIFDVYHRSGHGVSDLSVPFASEVLSTYPILRLTLCSGLRYTVRNYGHICMFSIVSRV